MQLQYTLEIVATASDLNSNYTIFKGNENPLC